MEYDDGTATNGAVCSAHAIIIRKNKLIPFTMSPYNNVLLEFTVSCVESGCAANGFFRGLFPVKSAVGPTRAFLEQVLSDENYDKHFNLSLSYKKSTAPTRDMANLLKELLPVSKEEEEHEEDEEDEEEDEEPTTKKQCVVEDAPHHTVFREVGTAFFADARNLKVQNEDLIACRPLQKSDVDNDTFYFRVFVDRK